MKINSHFLNTKPAGFVLGVLLLAALPPGAGLARGQTLIVRPPMIVVRPPVVVVAPAVVVAPVVVIEDDYVYYPDYCVYYNSHRHQYAYLDGGAWVFAAAPQGVTVEVLLASRSVPMNFHDTPERHHAEMMQRYPKHEKPAGEHKNKKKD